MVTRLGATAIWLIQVIAHRIRKGRAASSCGPAQSSYARLDLIGRGEGRGKQFEVRLRRKRKPT
jgi:hypothetical protein